MKYLFLLLFPLQLFAQGGKEQVIKSDIKRVKLFLTAAEILHQQKIVLNKGRNKLIFPGISVFADPKSIQFVGEGNFHLVSVSTEMDFLAAERFNPRITVLNDSLEKLNDRFQGNIDLLQSYDAELDVMQHNKDLGGKSQNITTAQIKEAGEYYRKRTLEIKNALSKLKKEQQKLQLSIENLRFQLVEMNYNENQKSNQVIVLIDVEESKTIETNLTYLVSDCGWAATYDLSAQDINQKVNLKYKAQIYNNTGNDWNNVQLILSTGDPRLSATAPVLNPWYLNYYGGKNMAYKKYNVTPQFEQQAYRNEALNNVNMANQRAYDNYYILDGKSSAEKKLEEYSVLNSSKLSQTIQVGNSSRATKQIEISELTTEFIIPAKFTCPADAKTYIVDVKEMNLQASFSHICVPKLDAGAFLMAHITGWQELELIPGPTNVYFGGAFVGVSEIDTRNVNDTLSLSFGRDNKVTVMRKLKQEMSSKKVFGNSKKETYLYENVVRNNRSVPIKIEIFDQIPVSRNTEISVYDEIISNGLKNAENGEVVWQLEIEPTGIKTVEIGYTIKYPKDAQITTKTFRTISAPSF